MNIEAPGSTRPLWLISGLAASCAVLVYRASGAVLELLVWFARRLPFQVAQWLSSWQYQVHLVAGLLLAVLCAKWQHGALERRSARANYVALAIFVVLAILPLRVRSSMELALVPAGLPVTGLPVTTNVEPASLRCKLIDGDAIGHDIIITEQNVRSAKAFAWDGNTYFVELMLDSQGRERIEQFTTREIGKRLGFWLDGNLVCSGKIMLPVTSGIIHMPGSFDRQEASEIAARINANR